MIETVIGGVIILLSGAILYLIELLNNVQKKLDLLCENFDGLREYLYEIDPQFDDEREIRARLSSSENSALLAPTDDMELISEKEKMGKRTLSTPFVHSD